MTIAQACEILQQTMRETEITKCNDVRIAKIQSIPRGGLVLDERGKYVRTEGWERAVDTK